MARRRSKRRAPALLLTAALLAGGALGYETFLAGGDGAVPGVNDVPPGDASQEAALVQQEDLRVMQTEAVLSSALQRGGAQAAQMRVPHNVSSANGKTLILPERSAPYYVTDLEKYGAQNFQRLRDGSYLLSVNVFVAAGAKLVLQSATGPL